MTVYKAKTTKPLTFNNSAIAKYFDKTEQY
jgi:hypothetical protein